MEEIFKEYVKKYDMNNELIRLKYNHSIRVMELAKKYAKALNFNEKDIFLMALIGLLHDYGRFEQLKRFNSFNDKETIDHAELGVRVLFEDGEIDKYLQEKEDYELIKFSILNHNKFEIPEIDNERYMKHAKLIRDIDKIDILYLLGFLGETNLKATNDKISSEVIQAFKEQKSLSYDKIKNKNDRIALYFAYAFDIYNDICLSEIKENINYLYQRLNNHEFDDIKKMTDNYIDERMKKRC